MWKEDSPLKPVFPFCQPIFSVYLHAASKKALVPFAISGTCQKPLKLLLTLPYPCLTMCTCGLKWPFAPICMTPQRSKFLVILHFYARYRFALFSRLINGRETKPGITSVYVTSWIKLWCFSVAEKWKNVVELRILECI